MLSKQALSTALNRPAHCLLVLIFGRDLIVFWYSDEAAGKIHSEELNPIGPKGRIRRTEQRFGIDPGKNDFAII